MKRKTFFFLPVLALFLAWGGCFSDSDDSGSKLKNTLTIVAGSESKAIAPIIQKFGRENDYAVQMIYQGSVEMMLDLRNPQFAYDAVLPANSMWIRLGDKDLHRVSEEASIMRSPVVLGVKKPLAKSLGWIDREVAVSDILAAIQADKLRFAMTSATQSNSGASAYMGLLFALAGKPDMLQQSHLKDPRVQADIKALLAGVDRSSGSSGWLKAMFMRHYHKLDAMFNYEAMIIDANQELVQQGKAPLYVIYPSDGLAIADSTLGFVKKKGNQQKLDFFVKLRDHLLSPGVQKEISKTGFRTGLIGMNPDDVDRSVFNPDWGIDLGRTISPIPWPEAAVIAEALRLYQTSFRKPSYTVYLLDVSGSMGASGLPQLKQAMEGLLNQQKAGQYFLQASDQDVFAVIPFNDKVLAGWKMIGNQPEDMQTLINHINGLKADGGTNIYQPVIRALALFKKEGAALEQYLPAILLMTDGKSNAGSLQQVQGHWQALDAGFDLPPIFGVTFGDADESQLNELAEFSTGRIFDGKKHGLAHAFRKVRGYN